jgi:hypothetical protein
MMGTILHVHRWLRLGSFGYVRGKRAGIRKRRHGATYEADEDSHTKGNYCGRQCLQCTKRKTHQLKLIRLGPPFSAIPIFSTLIYS